MLRSVQVMPRPFWASFSPSRQSPMYLPSAGALTVAMALASMRLAVSASGAVPVEQAAVSASWAMRSTLAMPSSRKDAVIMALNCASSSAALGPVAQPAAASTAVRPARAQAVVLRIFMVRSPGFSA